MTALWNIVEFEDGVQLVPNSWLNENVCYWPKATNQIKINKLIATRADPDKENWLLYKVIRVFGSSSEYENGIAKLKLCIQISDIDSTTSECEKKDRRSKRKIRTHSSSSDEERMPTPKKQLKSFPKAPVGNTEFQGNSSTASGNLVVAENSELHSANNIINQSNVSNDNSVTSSPNLMNTEYSCNNANIMINSNVFKVFQDYCIRKFNSLSSRLEIMHDHLLEIGGKGSEKFDSSTAKKIMEMLPLEKSVDEFEAFLGKVPKNMTATVTAFKGIGGGDEYHLVTNILKRVFSNSVAEGFSWAGAKKKRTFKSLKLATVLQEAVRAHNSNITEERVGIIAANWLRHAKQRRERQEKKNGGGDQPEEIE